MLAQNWAFARIPVSIQRLLDEIVGANRFAVVGNAALTATAFTLLAGGCMFLMRKLIIGVSRRIEYDLRDELFRRLISLAYGFFQRRRTGDLISRCTNDLTDVRMLLGPGMMYIPDALSRLALFLPLLLALDVMMTVALLVVAALLVALNLVVIPRFRPLYRTVQEQVGAINDSAWQTITGITTVKLYAAEAQQTAQFEELNRTYGPRQHAGAQDSRPAVAADGSGARAAATGDTVAGRLCRNPRRADHRRAVAVLDHGGVAGVPDHVAGLGSPRCCSRG